jgi:hypothetical protein
MVEWYTSGVEPHSGEYCFKVKDKEGEVVWIAAEPTGVPLKIIGSKGRDLQVGFDLAPGTTPSEARTLADAMNKGIVQIVLF